MWKLIKSSSPFVGGLLLLTFVYVAEFLTGISGSVAYVLTVLTILWLSWNSPHISWIGVFTTALMIAGFFQIDNNTEPAIAINRALAIVTIWLAVIFAIRYRRLSEAEIVQKRQLEALFENASEGMIFTNARGEILRINAAADRMFGYDAGELLGTNIEKLVPERYAKGHESERSRLLETPRMKPKGTGRELPARRKNGTEFFAEISLSFFYEGDQVFYIAFIVDISERKKQQQIIESNVDNIKRLNAALESKVRVRTAELESANLRLIGEVAERKAIAERLMKSQQLHSAIARNFPEGMIGVIDRDRRYLLADGQEMEFIQSDLLGQPLFGPHHPELNADAEIRLERAYRGEHVSFDVALKKRIYNITAVPLPDSQGQINEVLIVMQNVTGRKIAERKLVRTIEKEKQLSALKSRFVTMASHEFRTPLTTMLSSVFLLQNYSTDKYEVQKKIHLDRITRSIQTLTELMNDFLSLGSLEEGQVKVVYSSVELKSFLTEAISELQGLTKRGQEIQLHFVGEETSIVTDRQMLTNILRNLVSNAVKYSSEGSRIDVHADVDGHELILRVSDEGMGIPQQEQSEIFKRFYRAENATNIQGTGLGLNIVKKYVNILKGTISFKSRLNEGTTFTVSLPAREAHNMSRSTNLYNL